MGGPSGIPFPSGQEYYECTFLNETAWEIPEADWITNEEYLSVNVGSPVNELIAELSEALGAPTGCRKPDNFPI